MIQQIEVPVGLGLGLVFIDRPDFDSEGYPVYSRLLVCPVCHEVWAKLLCANTFAQPVGATCERCPAQLSNTSYIETLDIPGSILVYGITRTGLDLDLLNHLPEALLRREFNLHMKAFGDSSCPSATSSPSETAFLPSKTDS